MPEKVCTKCGESKPLTEFSPSAGCKDGTRNCCKKCMSIKASLHQAQMPEHRKKYMAEYYKAKPEKFPRRTKEQQDTYNETRRARYANDEDYRADTRRKIKEWQQSNPLARKNGHLKQYGITIDEFHLLVEKQDHKCAICGYSDTSKKSFFPVVDHCHNKGHVRGILCSACNFGIGKFKDDPQLLLNAINYLEADRERTMGNLV